MAQHSAKRRDAHGSHRAEPPAERSPAANEPLEQPFVLSAAARLSRARDRLLETPQVEFAAVTEEGDGCMVTRVLWRNGNTCEVSIPIEKWDPFLYLQAIEDCETPGRFAARMAELANAQAAASDNRPRQRG